MGAYGLKEIRRSSVVQEEDPLTNTPQRGGPKLVRSRLALDYIVCQVCSHVVQHQVRKQSDWPVLKNWAKHDRGGLHSRGVTQRTASAFKDDPAPAGAGARIRIGHRSVGEPHHELELLPVR